MEPVFIDFHIHTSDDVNSQNESYDLDQLKLKLEEISDGSRYLVSITDHNFINKSVYLKAKEELDNILLGVELHIRNYDEAPPYHCHILFNKDVIDEGVIDDINQKLDELYPGKVISKDDEAIPYIAIVMKKQKGEKEEKGVKPEWHLLKRNHLN